MASVQRIYEVPDGGWGWFVVLGATLINAFNQALLSVFGLLFGGYFTSLNESKIRIALVMNLCSTFLNCTGFLIGPIMKKFSKRQISLLGCFLVSFGLMLSSLTTTLNQVIFTYSLCVGVGLGLLGPAIFITVSEYFTTKKSRAVSLTMAGTGVGQMILPQIVKLFLQKYGFRGTVLLMGALSLHGALGACLFRPVEKNLRIREADREEMNENTPLIQMSTTFRSTNESDENNVTESVWRKIESSMDLVLLRDPRFMILNIGLACTYTVSVDFTLILPFFLQETAKLDKSQTALCMTVLATFDLLSRLTFHFFTDPLQLSHRTIFMIGTLSLGIIRSILAEQTNYTILLVTCAFFGYFRALIVVNQVLTVSEFCSKWYPQKLPGALGINMIMKAASLISIGVLLGWVRDLSGSYTISLHSQNILISIVMIFWVIELTWYRRH